MKSQEFGGKNKMKKICFISGSSPKFLGGISLYQRNLIDYAKKKKLGLKFSWIYPGRENKRYSLKEINCIEVKSCKSPFVKEFDFARKARKIINKEHFDFINTHANWGYFLKKYKKKENQKIIHTYHGVTYPYMKIQFSRFGFFKYLFYPLLPFIYQIEKPPIKKSDKIIYVSEKVKKELEKLYGKRKNVYVIRTGVNLEDFKKLPKEKSRDELNLEKEKIYGLYSGRGGYWNKGLDRAIILGEKLYKKNKNFRLIVIGSDKKKCEKYLDKKFVIYKGVINREELSKYLSASDFFFFLSRYEGGAPSLALSEAIASECLTICSKDSRQEIFENKKDCLIINNYGKESAERILGILGDKGKLKEIREGAKKRIKEFGLEGWGKKYFEVLRG